MIVNAPAGFVFAHRLGQINKTGYLGAIEVNVRWRYTMLIQQVYRLAFRKPFDCANNYLWEISKCFLRPPSGFR